MPEEPNPKRNRRRWRKRDMQCPEIEKKTRRKRRLSVIFLIVFAETGNGAVAHRK